ncbi:hypothetical protein KM043_000882 [Ampulex compressa]|nr:hypothetical protein KM043_000882 [Ampulex compressa]
MGPNATLVTALPSALRSARRRKEEGREVAMPERGRENHRRRKDGGTRWVWEKGQGGGKERDDVVARVEFFARTEVHLAVGGLVLGPEKRRAKGAKHG